MFVDSTALPEQVIDDVITSAFRSAGQRCSALRVLFLQREIANKTLTILEGAMHELIVGDPRRLVTDVGPVIDRRAKEAIDEHLVHLDKTAKLRAITPFDRTKYAGHFIAPQVWEIDALADLTHEVFGPVLHVIRYDTNELPRIFSEIRASEFALTMGVHSRLRGLHDRIRDEALVGNLYINRDTVGAVVGSPAFGGHGASGTGPKAGGPNYLKRLVNEHTVTDNITALGGNTALFNLE
jgi:RHH-type proline utilization regulon transcriptional repressor/proline dehydrogenase/delta 1-pyrroline-5-carboxylate dehydrogenase